MRAAGWLFGLAVLPWVAWAGGDFVKIANDGSELPKEAALGSRAADWGCVRDRRTGFLWEVKTADGGLRGADWTYSWLMEDGSANGGTVGVANGGHCGGRGGCDTQSYAAAVNTMPSWPGASSRGLCGFSDWRLPRRAEMRSIMDYRLSGPAMDPLFFPNTRSNIYWTASPYAVGSDRAWYTNARYGDFDWDGKGQAYRVRLVRGEER